MMLVARGRAEGIDQFAGTSQGFLASLAPLIAFPLVGTFLLLLDGDGAPAITDLLATLAVLLAPPVLSFELARLWGRQARWLRFATAFNWCQWLLPMLASVLAAGAWHAAASRPVGGRGDRARWCWASAATPCGCTGSWRGTAWRCRASAPRCWCWGSISARRCWCWRRGCWRCSAREHPRRGHLRPARGAAVRARPQRGAALRRSRHGRRSAQLLGDRDSACRPSSACN